MEAGLVRHAPRTQELVGERIGANNGSEEVHSPFGAPSLAGIDIEQSQRNLALAHPLLRRLIQRRLRSETIGHNVVNVEVVEGSAVRTVLGRVVDKRLVGDVVGANFVLEICRGVVGALVDECLHDFVLVDGVVGDLRLVEEEVGLVKRLEGQGQLGVGVAQINARSGEVLLVGDGLVVVDGAYSGASRDVDAGHIALCTSDETGGSGSEKQALAHDCWQLNAIATKFQGN